MVVLYLFLCIVFLVLYTTKDKFVYSSFVAIYLCFVVSLRMAEPQSDFVNYYGFLEYDWDQYFTNSYFLREFLFWFPAKYNYEIINNPPYVYIIYDIVLILTLSVFFNKDKKYILAFYWLIFPSVLGVGNIYRQFIIASILVYIILCKPRLFVALLLISISLFIHNMTIIFTPLILMRYGYIKISLSALTAMIFGLIFVDNYKSAVVSGTYMTIVYLAALFTLLAFLYFQRFMFKESLVLVVIAISTYILLPINQAERIAMVSFSILLTVSVLMASLKYKNTAVPVTLIAFFPTIVFPSSFLVLSARL